MLKAGLPFTVATARGWPGTRRVLGDLDIRLPVIVRNGAYVLDYQSGEVLLGNLIEPQIASEILSFYRKNGISPGVAIFSEGKEKMYGERPTNKHMAAYAELRRQQGTPPWFEVPNLAEVIKHPVAQFNIIDEGEAVLDFQDELGRIFGKKIKLHTYENVLQQGWRMLSILSSDAHKGAAAHWLLDYLSLDKSQLVAFGDNYNDLSMMKMAGTAVAVGNAQAAVMRVSHQVLRYDVEDEVVNYIEEMWDSIP
jgi:Cof subfamily protein (haloacid dehalogenase superfamily)